MLEILTPYSKIVRENRVMAPATFTATPGIWCEVSSDGSVVNVTAGLNEAAPINKMVLNPVSTNKYESHDTRGIGRVAVLGGPTGVRFKIDSDCFGGSASDYSQGYRLVVSTETATAGKLIAVDNGLNAGVYQVVAVVEQVDSTNGWLYCEYKAAGEYVTSTNSASASISPSASRSPSASISPSSSTSASISPSSSASPSA